MRQVEVWASKIWACFLSLAQSKLRLCLANHRAGYFSNLACDWLSIVWAYSEQETENGPWSLLTVVTAVLYSVSCDIIPYLYTGLILVLRPANDRRHYFVASSLIDWALTWFYSRFAPSEWEMELLWNDISHWLGTHLESALFTGLDFVSINHFQYVIMAYIWPLSFCGWDYVDRSVQERCNSSALAMELLLFLR